MAGRADDGGSPLLETANSLSDISSCRILCGHIRHHEMVQLQGAVWLRAGLHNVGEALRNSVRPEKEWMRRILLGT